MTTVHEQWDIVSSVGLTALGVAAARAVENDRPDALVRDPMAARFVAAAADAPTAMPTGRAAPGADTPMWRTMADFLGVRSRFLDDVVSGAVGSGIDQVVLLAAGLDVRAQRLDGLEGCSVYEVDQPTVLAFKDEVLDEAGAVARCDRVEVATDLRDDWAGALAAAGHDAGRPTVWLAEGLLPYLPAAAEAQLFATISALSAPGSRVGVEFVHDIDGLLRSDLMTSSSAAFGVDMGTLWSREPRRPADEVLRDAGWTTASESIEEAAARFGRDLDADAVGSVGRHGHLLEGRRA